MGYLAVIWLSSICILVALTSFPYALAGEPRVFTVAELASKDYGSLPRCLSIRDGFLIDDATVVQSIGDSDSSVPNWEYIAVISADHPDVRRYRETEALPEARRGNASRDILTRALADCRLIWMVRHSDMEKGKITWPSPPGSILTGVLQEAPSSIAQHFVERSPALASRKLLVLKAPQTPMTLQGAWIMLLLAGAVAGGCVLRWRIIGFMPVGSSPEDRNGMKAFVGLVVIVTTLSLLGMWYHDAL